MLLRMRRIRRLLVLQRIRLIWNGRGSSSGGGWPRPIGIVVHQVPEIHRDNYRRAVPTSIPRCFTCLSDPALHPASAGMRKKFQLRLVKTSKSCARRAKGDATRCRVRRSRRDAIGTRWDDDSRASRRHDQAAKARARTRTGTIAVDVAGGCRTRCRCRSSE